MSKNLELIRQIGILPLVVLQDAEDALPLAGALAEGGIPIAEVTFRTDAAEAAIAKIAEGRPDLLVGAGTVHTVDQAKRAVAAGGRFIVTPGFNPEVVSWCCENGIDVLPVVVSPADIEQAMGFGLSVCKFFPAAAYGGVKTLKALAGPYAGVSFLPTGGVNEENMLDYLSLPNVAGVGGSFTCPDKLVRAKDWAGIAALCRGLIQRVLGFSLAHVGINTASADEAASVAGRLGFLFGQPVEDLPGALFAGSLAEVVKGPYLGAHGHIGINTRDIDRAAAYFERIGVPLDWDTAARDDAGRLKAIYFKEEVGGFALHLRRFS